jgi:hypothetical protein
VSSTRTYKISHGSFRNDDVTSTCTTYDAEMMQMLASGRHKDFIELCDNKLSEYQTGHDLIVINGWRAGGFAINAELAVHLDAPVVLSMDYMRGESPQGCYDRAVRLHGILYLFLFILVHSRASRCAQQATQSS